MNKNKFTIIGIILTTIVLAGIAIFTAIKLYQTRNTQITPNAPESKPKAAGESCNPNASTSTCVVGEVCLPLATDPNSGSCTQTLCQTSFTISLPTATATSTSTTKATATATATATSTSTTKATATATATATSTSTTKATATATATATVTASPNPQCNNSCTSNSNCPSGLMCYIANGATTGSCRNTQCLSETDCVCPVATTTATATTLPVLPEVGTKWPTILGAGFGVMVIIGSLLLAL